MQGLSVRRTSMGTSYTNLECNHDIPKGTQTQTQTHTHTHTLCLSRSLSFSLCLSLPLPLSLSLSLFLFLFLSLSLALSLSIYMCVYLFLLPLSLWQSPYSCSFFVHSLSVSLAPLALKAYRAYQRKTIYILVLRRKTSGDSRSHGFW